MSSEDQIVRKLGIIDQSRFERLIDNLLYHGAFLDICPQNSFIEPFGVNPGKNRTIKSPSRADAEIICQGAIVEKSIRKDWGDKFKEDVAKNKKLKRIIKRFVFCTNQDTGTKNIKIGKKSIDAVGYCKKELECQECYIIGQRELLHPLQNSSFFFLRRSFLEIDEDFFCSPSDYLKTIGSNGAVTCNLAKDTLESYARDINKEVSFQPSGVIVLHNDDYIPLIHALGLWAIQKIENTDDIFEKDYSFIRWPGDSANADVGEISQALENFVIVWGADEIANLSGYLRFVNDKTTLIFVCHSAFKDEKVIDKIKAFNGKITIQEISIGSIDQRTASSKEITQHEKKLKTAIQYTLDSAMHLESLVYYYSPLYLNDSEKMSKIQRLLGVDLQQLTQLINTLKSNDFAQLTGNILWLKHPGVARTLLGDFINQGVFDIEDLVQNYMVSKEQLEKLMKLDNKKADNYLSGLALQLEEMVIKSKNNDFIYEKLETLESFVYKAPKQVTNIFKCILRSCYSVSKSRSKFGTFEGKTRADLILKGLDLLSEIRYILPNAVLPLLEKVITSEEDIIRKKALEILKRFSQYDYTVLFKSKVGYCAQRTVLDYILKWSPKKCLANLDFVLIVTKELLSSSVEGSSWTDEKTLTMNFTQVDPTDFLKKMRRETMDFLYNLYTKTLDPKVRLQLSSVLEEALRSPSNIKYSGSLRKMLDEDASYLVSIYRKMIFERSGNLIRGNIAVAEEIEERFYYFAKPEKGRPSELIQLREDILKDPFFNKVCPMIGGRAAYRGEEGYEESKQRREKDQYDLISQMTDGNLVEWSEILNILAKQKEVIEEWKLGDLKRFLEMLSSEKPEIADKLLSDAFKKNKSLINFTESFLIGFQVTQRFDLWDKYSELITKKRIIYLVGGVCNSLVAHTQEQVPRKLRSNELAILEEIVFKKKRFGFLKTKRKDTALWYLHDRLFHALAFNFKPQKRKIEWLIREEIQNNSEYANIHYHGLQFVATVWKWIDLSLASKAFKKYLLSKVVEAPNLDWHLQEFLIELCVKDFDCIVNLFKKRISRTVSLQKKDKSRGIKRLMKRKEFEAIPYHLNPDLQKLLTENQKRLAATVKTLVLKMTLGWSLYNWEVGRFLESINVDRQQVLSDIVTRGDDKDLLRVAYVIEGIGEADFELGMQIIGRTDNDKIHKKIGATMFATGVVSGEYGIADAYKGKIEILQKYKESKNRRIKKFALEMIGHLQKSEEMERKRTAEEIQLRKLQFEG